MPDTHKNRHLRKRIMTWLLILLSLYVVYCGLLFFFQTKLIFPASMAGQAGETLPTTDTVVYQLPTDQGMTTAWFVPAPDATSEAPAPLAVFFHGNAELIDQQQSIIGLYQRLGISLLMVEYRGYGHSDGTPSQEHIVADSIAILERVLQRDEVDATKLVLHGRSIGGGLATQVALNTDPQALIVESTFTSVTSMAWRYGVPPFIVRSPLNSLEAFGQLDNPILIMHGWEDQIVPVDHAKRLYDATEHARLVLFDADHNNLPTPHQAVLYQQSVQDVLFKTGLVKARYWDEHGPKPARSTP